MCQFKVVAARTDANILPLCNTDGLPLKSNREHNLDCESLKGERDANT